MTIVDISVITNPLLRELAARGVQRRFGKGSILIQEGDEGSTLYIVLSGRLRAYSESPDGKQREITYGIYSIGDLLGEMSLDGGLRSANVMALDHAVCSVITRETLRKYIGEAPDFAFDLISRVIKRARKVTLMAKHLALTDAYGRLNELLTTEAKRNSQGVLEMPHRMSHQQISTIVGCSREMISRLLKDLEMGGFIGVNERRCIRINKALPSHW